MNLFPHRTAHGLRLAMHNAGEIARLCEGLLEGDASLAISGAAPLQKAQRTDIAFCAGDEFLSQARSGRAGVLVVPFDWKHGLEFSPCIIQVKDPYASMVYVLQQWHAPTVEWSEAKISWDATVHPTSVVEGVVWPGAVIGPFCVVPAGSEVGWNTILESHVTLYPGVQIGNSCRIQAGVVIGSQGFGLRRESGARQVAVPHFGGVEIQDHVQIGANSVVAAGFLEPTRIGEGCKFDSFVQIAHHCQVGANVTMSSGAGLAGGVTVGKDSLFGGAAQVAQHVHIGERVRIGAKAGVTKNIPDGAVVAGFPAEPIQAWRRGVVALRRLVQTDTSDLPE